MNVVYILSDRHNPEFAGCYGNRISRTPHMDRLAERGVRFDQAYCVSPLCVPARAAMMTGRYVFEIGAWDNAFPYTGIPGGWGHYFREQGICFTTIGKLDFQPGVDHGIEDERLPIHRESLDIHSLFRDEIEPRYHLLHRLRSAAPSDMRPFRSHDDRVVEASIRWLTEERPADRPWILNVNFNHLHRFVPPRELWDYYDPLVRFEDLDERYSEDPSRLHPFNQAFARHTCGGLATPEDVRRGHVGYYGLCEVLDRNVGRVIQALEEAGLLAETLVVYTSDHGGSLGAHANLDHGSMYEDSIRVPLIFAGPGIRSGAAASAPVSHLDMFSTFCEAVGLELPAHLRGVSLLGLLRGEKDAPAPPFVLCDYHGNGFPGSVFVLRSGRFKYLECVGERPMLFDLEADPHEMHDLVAERPEDPEVKATVQRLRRTLCEVCSPEAVDARTKADQRRLRKELKESGRLVEEMWRRGYERNPDRLVHRPEELP